MQACGVITAYYVSLLGKLSLVLMSVPQKIHNKLGLVKKRAKSLQKNPLPFSQGLRKACTVFFFPRVSLSGHLAMLSHAQKEIFLLGEKCIENFSG